MHKLKVAAISLAALVSSLAPGTHFLVVVNAEAKLFCSKDGKRFNEWKRAVKKEYRGRYKPSTLKKLDAVKYDTSVIRLDRTNLKSFKGTFEDF